MPKECRLQRGGLMRINANWSKVEKIARANSRESGAPQWMVETQSADIYSKSTFSSQDYSDLWIPKSRSTTINSTSMADKYFLGATRHYVYDIGKIHKSLKMYIYSIYHNRNHYMLYIIVCIYLWYEYRSQSRVLKRCIIGQWNL